jgi:hypothetical protein
MGWERFKGCMVCESFIVKLRIFEAIHIETDILVLFVQSFDYISYYRYTMAGVALETKRLKMLMAKFSLSHAIACSSSPADVIALLNTGSWQSNTDFKSV